MKAHTIECMRSGITACTCSQPATENEEYCTCKTPEPYSITGQGICAPMMPIGWCKAMDDSMPVDEFTEASIKKSAKEGKIDCGCLSEHEPVVMVLCVGVDYKQHVCEPHKDKCKCGVQVKRKKLLKNDYDLFSCYECTF